MNTVNLLAFLGLLACNGSSMVRMGPVKAPAPTINPLQNMRFHDLSATDIHGGTIGMEQFKGRKILLVNTASECGYTRQYEQLQELYSNYKDKGFTILAFPCNDFGGQEPGSEAEIEAFCTSKYNVTFPLMSKVVIKGEDRHPIFEWLCSKEMNGVMDVTVKWNFHKFLIDEEGQLIASYGSGTDPLDEKILSWIGN